ncbi:ABC transporter permease [Propionimicrobium lymphophilum]|uniref:ABC transporter permease n=1 Tax=Propionimicrobium lymphophilum TaxID=33012 RepID=UPI0023EFDCB6|nr:ABC transporter permease [Propionimicrobium lymphophilum]
MTIMQIDPTWQLAIALIALCALAATVARFAKLTLSKQIIIAAIRSILQLAAVSFIVVLAVQRWWSGLLFIIAMFLYAVWTTTGTVKNRNSFLWVCLAMGSGVLPVLAVIFLSETAPFNGFSLVPIGSIIIGNVMKAQTLTGRRIFGTLRENIGIYEAALALGFKRPQAVWIVIKPERKEALIPNIDSTKTAGLVTLPGAFIGVLLGGGTALQAGASQVLVLLGIMAGQVCCVAVSHELIKRTKLLPPYLKAALHP